MRAESVREQTWVVLWGDRLPGEHAEQTDEQPVLVGGAARDDRHAMEPAVAERLRRGVRQDVVAEGVRLKLDAWENRSCTGTRRRQPSAAAGSVQPN
jgi:hypothetical protein